MDERKDILIMTREEVQRYQVIKQVMNYPTRQGGVVHFW